MCKSIHHNGDIVDQWDRDGLFNKSYLDNCLATWGKLNLDSHLTVLNQIMFYQD